MKRLILASGSPRRSELLKMAGFEFMIVPARGEEVRTKEIPAELVEELSLQKGKEVAERIIHDQNGVLNHDLVVIGADTVVAIGHEVLGKPDGHDSAVAMIGKLQGSVHQVYTGVSVLSIDKENAGDESRWVVNTFYESTDVDVYPMSEEEIEEYARSAEPYDKAGAYGIQGIFGEKYIRKIDGDYYNVVGLPVSRLYHELKKMGLAKSLL